MYIIIICCSGLSEGEGGGWGRGVNAMLARST